MNVKLIIQAKKNSHDYKIIEKFVAGIVLTGNEIKSLHNHQTSISEAYILPHQKELYISNMHISAYKYSHASDLAKAHNTKRKRKLLLNRKEINKIIRQLKSKNYVLIPLQLFFSNKG
jgi:SsrA-binding protein